MSTSMKIVAFCNMEVHHHEEDLEYSTMINYHWTIAQEAILDQYAKQPGKNNNKIILRDLMESNAIKWNWYI